MFLDIAGHTFSHRVSHIDRSPNFAPLRSHRRLGVATLILVLIALGIGVAGIAQTRPKLFFSADKKTIRVGSSLTESTVACELLKVLRQKSVVAPNSELEGIEFSAAELSPDFKWIAFTVTGGVRDWVGIFSHETKSSKDVDIINGGVFGSILWSPGSRYVAVEATPASGYRTIRIIDAVQGKLVYSLSQLFSKGLAKDQQLETYSPSWMTGETLIFKKKIWGENTVAEETRFTIPR